MNKIEFLQSFKNVIESNDRIAIFHHKNVDGDSISSSFGLAFALIKKYPSKKINVISIDEELAIISKTPNVDTSIVIKSIDDSYVGIIGDTSSKDLINGYEDFMKAKMKICFDHHQNDPNINYDLYWKASDYPASALQAYEIADYLNVELDEKIAYHLLIGIYTDTGGFAYSSNNVMPLQYYANLLKRVSHEKINLFYNKMKQKSKEDLELQKIILQNIFYHKNISYVYCNKEITNKYSFFQIRKYINFFGNIEGYNIWALFCEEEEVIKSEYRSTGPNVGEFAKKMGGGGHVKASGASLPKTTNINDILDELSNLK